jgi:hypothetical protein
MKQTIKNIEAGRLYSSNIFGAYHSLPNTRYTVVCILEMPAAKYVLSLLFAHQLPHQASCAQCGQYKHMQLERT